ncbi:hypothetical protein NKH54_12380 [Mesorhizobium sp. M1004]|uniref:hypothetical protein n=1 Tax=Mesorhizobium sp. M1004 TaxID=2957046 RepID=UPI00333AE3C5
MVARGRKSAASLAIQTINIGQATPLRPAEGLSEAETAIWFDVIACMPSGFFRPENAELLASYVRHSVSARDLSKMVAEFRPDWIVKEGGLERFDRLLKMRERESRAASAAARSLRMTPQSQQDPKTAARNRNSGWEPSAYEMMAND